MTLMRPLLPYAAVALLVVVGSAAALVYSLPRDGAVPAAPATPTAVSLLTGADRGAMARQLGRPRFAYWRVDPSGQRRLWVSDAVGSRRWPIGPLTPRDDVRLTRWSPDGTGVAYVLANTELVVSWLDGENLRLPAWRDPGAGEARRIIGYAWSADGRRIAATQRQGSGRTSPTDVFVTDLGSGRWVQATFAGDVHVAEWAGADQLLVETSGGLVGVLRIGETDAIRPLTGMSAASPRIGPDGRTYFGGGHVTYELSFTEPRFVQGSVWSTSVEGDAREEGPQVPEQFRIEGRWPDGRFILRVVPGGMKLSGGPPGGGTGNLPFLAGTIRRVAIAPDGSAAYGITDGRILLLDLELAVTSPASAGAATVVLDQAEEADVWFPRTPVALGDLSAPLFAALPARSAFVHAGRVWITDGDGNARAVHAVHPSGAWFLRPRWSPDGERLLVAEIARAGNEQRYTILLFDRTGGLTRLDHGTGQRWVSSVAWAPAGDRIAVAGGDITAGWAEGEVRVLDLEGTEHGPRIPGRDVVWTEGGLFVLGNGRTHEQLSGARVGHSIDRLSGGARRTITDADRLALDPRSGFAAGVGAGIGQLAASADGSYLSVHLDRVNLSGRERQQTIAIVRTADGTATSFLSFDPGRASIGDVEWSPRGALIGHTATESAGSLPGSTWTTAAVVRDASGRVLAEHEGRFAGWSPDGSWFYVSRPAGLHAYRTDGGADMRVGPLGVSVVTTRR